MNVFGEYRDTSRRAVNNPSRSRRTHVSLRGKNIARRANATITKFAPIPVPSVFAPSSIVFRYSAGDLSRRRYARVYADDYRPFPLFRAAARNSPTKWNVLRLAAGQLTNTRRQGLPKTALALWKLRPASLDVTLQNNLNCTRNSLFTPTRASCSRRKCIKVGTERGCLGQLCCKSWRVSSYTILSDLVRSVKTLCIHHSYIKDKCASGIA